MSDPDIRQRALGCLLGGAVGDALGAPIEFWTVDQIRDRYGPGGLTDYAPCYGGIGRITDDTQMTLFTLEGLIRARVHGRARGRAGGVVHEPTVVHRAYLRWLHTQGDPIPDEISTGWLISNRELFDQRAPGSTCLSALRAGLGRMANPPTIDAVPNDSKGCGAVMRVAPVALFADTPAEAFKLGVQTGVLTHGHPSGYLSAGAMAALIHLLLGGAALDTAIGKTLDELRQWPGHQEQDQALLRALDLAERGRPTPERIDQALGGGWVGEEALAIAVCAALCATDFRDGLRMAVNISGDSDSTGSLCGAILGVRDGVEPIPSEWLDRLELREVIVQLTEDALAERHDPVELDSEDGARWYQRYPGT